MESSISAESLETIANLLVPEGKIRVYSEGMVFEARPLAPLTRTQLSAGLKADPSLFTFFNYLFRLKPLMSFESLSNRLIGEIRISLRDIEQEYSRQDLLANILSSLTLDQLTNLALGGVGICSLEEDEYCWAIKEIDSFVMEVRCEAGGRWKFPPCTLGIPFYSPTEMELTVYVLQPSNYVHPFLVDAGAICMGSFADSHSLNKITQTTNLASKIIHLFSYAEQILVSGYRVGEGLEPAISIFESIFNRYRLK